MAIDLTGGEVKVIGNCGDVHSFRLSNPDGQEIINSEGEYQVEFIAKNRNGVSPVEVDSNEIDAGILSFTVTIKSGIYIVRRISPRRTILTLEVESR